MARVDAPSADTFARLVEDHGARVLNTAWRILGDGQQAQDVHQDVFLAIWRRWHRYDGQTNWGSYLYRVTVRTALAQARRQRFESGARRVADRPGVTAEPGAAMATAELRAKLSAALARLPRRQAEVFVLARLEGLGYEEIAKALDCTPQTARVHLHRAMKRLARELGPYRS